MARPCPLRVWFGEKDEKLYVMTRSDSGKFKRIRNNPQVRIAPCTIRGKITGPEIAATARILPPEDWPWARKTLQQKYWLTRITFFVEQSSTSYVEIEIPQSLAIDCQCRAIVERFAICRILPFPVTIFLPSQA